MSGDEERKSTYGCSDYRDEMRLLGLKKRLECAGLTDAEREAMETEIRALERKMGLE